MHFPYFWDFKLEAVTLLGCAVVVYSQRPKSICEASLRCRIRVYDVVFRLTTSLRLPLAVIFVCPRRKLLCQVPENRRGWHIWRCVGRLIEVVEEMIRISRAGICTRLLRFRRIRLISLMVRLRDSRGLLIRSVIEGLLSKRRTALSMQIAGLRPAMRHGAFSQYRRSPSSCHRRSALAA